MAKALMIAKHTVNDYAAWRKTYDNVQPMRDKYGVSDAAVFRDAETPNDVTVLHWFPSADSARAFATSPELKEAMQEAGVSGPPRIEINVEA